MFCVIYLLPVLFIYVWVLDSECVVGVGVVEFSVEFVCSNIFD